MALRAPSVCPYCTRAHHRIDACEPVQRMARERKARFDRKRPNSSQRGYGRDWEDAARAFLDRPENKHCARCAEIHGKEVTATVVMHIRSVRTAPHLRMDQANWRPGCQRCNAIEAAEERRTMKGTRQ